MDRPTRIVPPIRFTSTEGDEASIAAATTLVEHLDALYDTLLDPRRREAHVAGTLRTTHLDTIEGLLFRVTDEMGRGAPQAQRRAADPGSAADRPVPADRHAGAGRPGARTGRRSDPS